jgi:hypothetical protein
MWHSNWIFSKSYSILKIIIMKTTILSLSILAISSITTVFSQNRTTVNAYNSEISDNLDLRAVASIFGDSRDLEDFERRLNDPKMQISNLDLNRDNQVDYLRVIESIEGNTHLVVIQSVLGRDMYQDIATVEVERDRFNRVQVQVVGDVFMYGNNYIYEPIYSFTPVIYSSFWIGNYTPYCSTWYWGFYPSYYNFWAPYPIYRYQSNIGFCINNYHHYNYVNYRRCEVAYNSYRGRRGNAYENRYPNRSFNSRNQNYANRYELENSRNSRNNSAYTNIRNYANTNVTTRENSNPRSVTQRTQTSRNYIQNENSTRGNSNQRNETQRSSETRNNNRNSEITRIVRNAQTSPKDFSNSTAERIRNNENKRENNYGSSSQRNSNSKEYSSRKENNTKNESNSRGNKRG